MDRISQLPEPILHQILSNLSPKHALRTCALSKAWRHVASTRPIVELREESGPFRTNRQTFFSFLDTTLQRYLDQNLSIQSLVLDISYADNPDAVSLLDKWIPIVATNMPVKRLDLSFQSNYYHLPPILLQSESLDELNLHSCRLTRIGPTDPILLSRLRTLSLTYVYASNETLQRMISGIERVFLTRCYVLGAIKVNGNNLKHFFLLDGSVDGRLTIEIIDTPSIETITITGHDNWIHAPNHSSFARLKSLSLSNVRLSENSFISLSDPDYLGCLQDLTLSYCHGFKEFRLTSTSVKNLTLNLDEKKFDIDVDVPNIVCFELSYFDRQPSIFFTTTSTEWKSEIGFNVVFSQFYDNQMLLNIYQLHKAALSRSEFSLHIQAPSKLLRRQLEDEAVSLYPPAVVIEGFSMWVIKHSSSSTGAFLRHLFCFFHPRFIYANKYEYPIEAERHPWYSNKEYCLVRILEHAKIPGLEEVSIESFKGNGQQQSECGLSSNDSDKNIRLRLKWGELSSLQA